MTDLKTKDDVSKFKTQVHNYLASRRAKQLKKDPTHISYGLLAGSFALDEHEEQEFMKLYKRAIDNGVDDFSILECQRKDYGPILIDIDIKIPIDNYEENKRLYDNNLVMNILNKYIKVINKYLDIRAKTAEKIKIYFLEKDTVTLSDSVCKDGFHIVIPHICPVPQIRHVIRHEVVKLCEEEKTFEGFIEGADKIIDKAVVSSNSWFLYGSMKPMASKYKLTKVFDYKLNTVYDSKNVDELSSDSDDNNYSVKELISDLSIRSSRYIKNIRLHEDFTESDVDALCDKLALNVKVDKTNFNMTTSKEDDVRRATKFVSLFDSARADNYSDWLYTGLALHNVEDNLLPVWIEFSKLSKKYKNGECEKMWKTMKNQVGNVLTIRSLAYWAKQDNPKEYDIFIKQEFKDMMNDILDNDIVDVNQHYKIAKIIHSKYSDKFVCSNLKNNIWWEFKNHRWFKIDEGYTLKILLSEDFVNEFYNEINELTAKQKAGKVDNKECTNVLKKITKIISNLLNTPFKKTIISECSNLFYDCDFETKLNSNIHLLAFENGVFDLASKRFRDGRPDDFISFSTKNNYYHWSEKNSYYKPIMTFFEQVLPNKIVREYFLNALCTCISGETKEEKLYILTGSGSNGKSLTMDLMCFALGDYFMSCPITVITRKRGQSNETAPEKVRMKGRRCGVFQETDDGEKVNVGVMKEMTGGDKIIARDLFKGAGEMIEFKPQMKYFLTCNQLPTIPSNDDGTWRRLRVIEFSSKFTDNPTKPNEFKIDTMLKQKIEQWGPAFASFLLHTYVHEYSKKTYLKEPDEVLASTNQYKMVNDPYEQFSNERINKVPNSKKTISRESIYETFKSWYKFQYEKKDVPKKPDIIKEFTKILGEPGPRGFKGVEFKILVESSINEESGDESKEEKVAISI